MCIPYTQCRLYEITEHSDACRQPNCFFITCPWVPGQYGKLTLLFRNPYLYPVNQITVTFESSSCTLLSAWNRQSYQAADAQLLETICFHSFFLSCNYPVRPLPVTCQSLESVCNVWTYIWTSSPQLHVPVWWMSSKMLPWEGQAWPKGRQKGFILLFRGKNKLNGRTCQKIV